jgi:hypothetical protein
MDGDLEKHHAALMAASAKYANKVSPLLIACGLIQEGLNLNQAIAGHADNLKKELDGIKKREAANKAHPTVRESAPGQPADQNRS